MASNNVQEDENDISYLKQQLNVARNEIHNLRQQIKSLNHSQQKEVERIHTVLESWQCQSCRCSPAMPIGDTTLPNVPEETILLRPIGLVSTWFPEKRATPRQPGICASSQGKLTLYNSVFTNPEHALEGLECFSHMWILFYFHKNDSTHVRAKVSPPRLNGARTGVFGTRSPHRPSPIGLSLVSIDKIDGATVYFSGVDMVDGTPVIDIKPFIPQYDNPVHYESPDSTTVPSSRLMDGREAENETPANASAGHTDSVGTVLSLGNSMDRSSLRVESRIGEREAPDGEEEISSPSTATASISVQSERTSVSPSTQVRVPSWITQPPVSKLSVTFTDRAKAQLEEISCISGTVESPLVSIKNVLQEDPRSVYLRERWGNQFYTFLICNLHVSCKFNDCDHTVAVFQVKSAGKLCECGQPEWQCSVHGTSC